MRCPISQTLGPIAFGDAARPGPIRSMEKSNYRSFYCGHMLTCRPQAQDDGRFQARVAISALGGIKTQMQRFLDLTCFDSHDEAVEHARLAGMEWIDKNVRSVAGH